MSVKTYLVQLNWVSGCQSVERIDHSSCCVRGQPSEGHLPVADKGGGLR